MKTIGNGTKSAICEILASVLVVKHSAKELYLIKLRKFQHKKGIQSKLFFKINISSSKHFQAVLF